MYSIEGGALGFQKWNEMWLQELLRVLKPGAHALVMGCTRTWHRMVAAAEDVGFEIRDAISYCYASGFPKSLNVSREIDRKLGAKRKVIGEYDRPNETSGLAGGKKERTKTTIRVTEPASAEAKKWDGWGTSMKPAHELIIVLRKPFRGTVAASVLERGTGAINIDGCRIGNSGGVSATTKVGKPGRTDGVLSSSLYTKRKPVALEKGRWPTNVVVDDAVQEKLGKNGHFFYCAKPSPAERHRFSKEPMTHPTLKPLALFEYMTRLIAPPGSLVLDPFMGSGTEGIICVQNGWRFIGIEKQKHWFKVACERIKNAKHGRERVMSREQVARTNSGRALHNMLDREYNKPRQDD